MNRLFFALVAILAIPACCPPVDCPELEPADLITATTVEGRFGTCGALAPDGLAYCGAYNPDADASAPACYVDGWACQSVMLADGSLLSRLDLHGPINGRTITATGVGYLRDGTTCAASYTITLN